MTKSITSRRYALVWAIGLLVIEGATIGIFLTFVPAVPRYSYWVALIDVLLLETVIGTGLAYYHLIASGQRRTMLPIAMSIAIGSTFSLFSMIGLVIVIVFLVAFNRSDFDPIFLWIVIGKWILLAVTVTIMWFAGKTGQESKQTLEILREKRLKILARMEQALDDIRHLPIDDEERTIYRQVTDDIEILSNKLRSRIFASPQSEDKKEDIIAGLIEKLAEAIGNPVHIREGRIKLILAEVQTVTKKIARELRSL